MSFTRYWICVAHAVEEIAEKVSPSFLSGVEKAMRSMMSK